MVLMPYLRVSAALKNTVWRVRASYREKASADRKLADTY